MLPLSVSDATTHSNQQTGSALGSCFQLHFLELVWHRSSFTFAASRGAPLHVGSGSPQCKRRRELIRCVAASLYATCRSAASLAEGLGGSSLFCALYRDLHTTPVPFGIPLRNPTGRGTTVPGLTRLSFSLSYLSPRRWRGSWKYADGLTKACKKRKTIVGAQTRGLGPYSTNPDIPTLGAGGETAGICTGVRG